MMTKFRLPEYEKKSIAVSKKNRAASLDPWEILVLLALKIPFHFISLRRLKNYIQF